MIGYWNRLQEKINGREPRERLLIFLSAVAVVYMLWSLTIQASLDTKIKASRAQIEAMTQQRLTIQGQVNSISQAVMNDPVRLKKAQIDKLENELGEVSIQLLSVANNLIKANELPSALQQVFEKMTLVNLIEINTLPTKPVPLHPVTVTHVTNAKDKSGEPSVEKNKSGVYQHTVVLRFSGNYFQVVEFIKALEALPWRFYWERLDYKVTQYPQAEVTLFVYTLSAEEGLFGV